MLPDQDFRCQILSVVMFQNFCVAFGHQAYGVLLLLSCLTKCFNHHLITVTPELKAILEGSGREWDSGRRRGKGGRFLMVFESLVSG